MFLQETRTGAVNKPPWQLSVGSWGLVASNLVPSLGALDHWWKEKYTSPYAQHRREKMHTCLPCYGCTLLGYKSGDLAECCGDVKAGAQNLSSLAQKCHRP